MKYILLFLLLSALLYADFQLLRLDMKIDEIKEDGSARVQENIVFAIRTNYSKSLYESGFNNNDLSFWTTTTGLREVKFHIDPNNVEISNFRLRPQPIYCNPFLERCNGELIIEYQTSPLINKTDGHPINGTGLFSVTHPKPRTTRYQVNSRSLGFNPTDQGDLILSDNNYLTIKLPENSMLLDANPIPQGMTLNFPARLRELTFTNVILVKFAVVFDVEASIVEEVSDFFSDLLGSVLRLIVGEQGLAVIVIIAILIGSYVYLKSKTKQQE